MADTATAPDVEAAPARFGSNPMVVLGYIVVFAMWALPQVIAVPVPINIVVTATALVYLGCHRSLRLRDKGHPDNADSEVISKDDAYKFPLMGSAMLFGLYLLVKFVNADLLAKLLSFYFGALGAVTVAGTVAPVVGLVLTSKSKFGKVLMLPLLGEADLTFTLAELASLVGGIAFAIYYAMTKHWAANNLIGMSFCVQAMERISLGSYHVGAILLVGLFFYDIFWVFGTEVMVTVAKSIDGPIKLLFPRVLAALSDPDADPPVKNQFSMLGLGDIVIPGIFVALLLRFDAERKGVAVTQGEHACFQRPTFHAGVVGYILGLSTTIFIMYRFDAAQPALLYLVPACLLCSSGVAMAQGQFKALWAYSEEDEEKEEEGEGDKKTK